MRLEVSKRKLRRATCQRPASRADRFFVSVDVPSNSEYRSVDAPGASAALEPTAEWSGQAHRVGGIDEQGSPCRAAINDTEAVSLPKCSRGAQRVYQRWARPASRRAVAPSRHTTPYRCPRRTLAPAVAAPALTGPQP